MTRKTPQQFTTVQDAPIADEGREPYTPAEAKTKRRTARPDPNGGSRGEDRVYGIESRARWGNPDIAELHHDTRVIEGSASASEEEEEEGTDSSQLTVSQLKDALDAAKVEYPANAKKADLVKLYDENELGG